jgi:peptidoglycan/LPS O-acetylase OafA/YrhL
MRSPIEEQRHSAGGEALMGFGMAAMAVPAAVVTPPRWTWLAYAALFGAAALRALWAARRSPHHVHHVVGAFAMVYMAGVMAAAPGHSGHHGHGGSGIPLVTGALLLYFAGYVLRSGARLLPVTAVTGGTRATAGGTRTLGWGDRPELSQACRLSMGIAMLAMLVTL